MSKFKVDYVFVNVEGPAPIAGVSLTDGIKRERVYLDDPRIDAFPAAKSEAQRMISTLCR